MHNALDFIDNNKDIKIAQDFNTALKLGCFDQEFVYYGIGYLDQGEIKYKVSADKTILQKFYLKSASDDIYTTNIVRFDKLCPVPSGKEDSIKLQMKQQTALQVRRLYNKYYFMMLESIRHTPASDYAYALLEECKNNLEGEYDQARINLFEQLVQIAVNSKCLTIQKELEFQRWINEQYKQLENDLVKSAGYYKRTLYGFAYLDNNQTVRYFSDATEHVVNDTYIAKQVEGIVCSPIYSKKIVLNSMSFFQKEKSKFQEEMKVLLGEEYMPMVRKIKEMPSAIEQQIFLEKCEAVKAACSEEAYRAFLAYGYRWNCSMQHVGD